LKILLAPFDSLLREEQISPLIFENKYMGWVLEQILNPIIVI
jgi:hypothetical protein